MRNSTPIIIGGGPAGCAAAIRLAKAGCEVILLERSTVTKDAICGGFVSWETLASFKQLGIDAAELGGHMATRVRVYSGHRIISAPLPRPGMGLSRSRMDRLMITYAAQCGARVERGVKVRTLETRDDGMHHIQVANGPDLVSDTVFLATGKFELPSHVRVMPKKLVSDAVLGLRLRLPPSEQLTKLVGDAIELHVFDRGYVGLNLQEDGSGNLCLAVHKSRLTEAGGSPAALLQILAHELPQLGERMIDFVPDAKDAAPIDAIANVPYGWRTAHSVPGLFRVGDQAGVIPSLAGEGMGIALASSAQAVAAWQTHGPSGAVAYQKSFAGQLSRPLRIAGLLWYWGERPQISAPVIALLARTPRLTQYLATLTRIKNT